MLTSVHRTMSANHLMWLTILQQVIKNAGETLHWSEPISITAGRGGRDTNTLIVRLHTTSCHCQALLHSQALY